MKESEEIVKCKDVLWETKVMIIHILVFPVKAEQ